MRKPWTPSPEQQRKRVTTLLAKLKAKVEPYIDQILEGKLIAIDPSSNSVGYCTFDSGLFLERGKLVAKSTDSPHTRLGAIAQAVALEAQGCDIAVMEEIHNRKTHVTLLRACGACMAGLGDVPVLFEVDPTLWHTIAPPGYEKDDDTDAYLLGQLIINLAVECHLDLGGEL
jgi:hypothetical protein